MKEYNNFYNREDISCMGCDPLRYYHVDYIIKKAINQFPDNGFKQRDLVIQECAFYWSIEIEDTEIIKYAGLQNETKEAMKDVYKEYNIAISPKVNCIVKAFYYQDKRWFYWWDLYNGKVLINSGLEFFPWNNHPASYIVFATEPTQSPLMCTPLFKEIRQF